LSNVVDIMEPPMHIIASTTGTRPIVQRNIRIEIMATLTYWKANIVNDSDVYSIRAKTRKEALAILSDPDNASFAYESPVKVTIDYVNAFDLMLQCKGESFDNL
jgi:hypothetical protein